MLRDFKKEKEMPKEIIEKYKGQVPDEVIEIWKNYGLGSFLNGYLRVINPDDYKELVEETYFRGKESIPLFVTAFADVITWQENRYIGIIFYKEEDFDIMASGMDFFFSDIYTEESFRKEFFDLKLYEKAVKRYGELEYNQSFCFVPLLGLGGKKSVDNLDKGDTLTHIYLITELVGKVGIDD